jgi:N-acetylglucosaminyldiphosphoundecaprenol N-acetyl-beta-D-mannosaminyltransferase
MSSITLFNLNFYQQSFETLLKDLAMPCLVMAPATAALIHIHNNPAYYQALSRADILLPDGGLMMLLWNSTHIQWGKRLSGYKCMQAYFKVLTFEASKAVFYILPSEFEKQLCIKWLDQNHFCSMPDRLYVAPHYNKCAVEDPSLVSILNQAQPSAIIIALGGGTQELLGAYLTDTIQTKATILCTGAALSFLTGGQKRIPNWVDTLYLGWLWRCLCKPSVYVPRYFKALQFVSLYLKEYMRF